MKLYSAVAVFAASVAVTSGQATCPNDCSGHGVCTPQPDGTDFSYCVCDGGYWGDDCSDGICQSEVFLTGTSGTISNDLNGGYYQQNMDCAWRIVPEDPNASIRFTVNRFTIESGWDYVYLHDGPGSTAPIAQTLSGSITTGTVYRTSQPNAYIQFLTDYSGQMSGFSIDWEIEECYHDCNGEATACPRDGTGICDCPVAADLLGGNGPGCGMMPCSPSTAAPGCLNGGTCGEDMTCECPSDWFGSHCDAPTCQPMNVETDFNGVITHGGAPGYVPNTLCTFLINPPEDEGTIHLNLAWAELEAGDTVQVFDGLHQNELLAEVSGYTAGVMVGDFQRSSVVVQFTSSPYSIGGGGFLMFYNVSVPTTSPPPEFSEENYTFYFVGGRRAVGKVVGGVNATVPGSDEGGAITYTLLNQEDRYAIEANGEIRVVKKPKKGVEDLVVVQACGFSGAAAMCAVADVRLVVTAEGGCMRDGSCPTRPQFSLPEYEFVFTGGRRTLGAVVGSVAAVDPVGGGGVTYEAVGKGSWGFEILPNGDIVAQRRLRKGRVFQLTAQACSQFSCGTVPVTLAAVDHNGCLKNGDCPGEPDNLLDSDDSAGDLSPPP